VGFLLRKFGAVLDFLKEDNDKWFAWIIKRHYCGGLELINKKTTPLGYAIILA
jgi:hypothetical protein